MSGEAPSISGPLASGLREVVREMVGPEAVDMALSELPGDAKEHFRTFTTVEWVPIEVMEAAFAAIARHAGTDVATLHERVARISIERTMRSLWRVLLRFTTDKALISRTPVIFAKSYNRGRLIADIPAPGQGEIELLDWPDAPEWTLRATRIGVATVLGIAGRRDVEVRATRTSGGARYSARWS